MKLQERLTRIRAKIKLALPLSAYEKSLWILYGDRND